MSVHLSKPFLHSGLSGRRFSEVASGAEPLLANWNGRDFPISNNSGDIGQTWLGPSALRIATRVARKLAVW